MISHIKMISYIKISCIKYIIFSFKNGRLSVENISAGNIRRQAGKERLALLGIMEAQMRAPETPRITIARYSTDGFRGTFNQAPIIPRDDSPSDSGCNFLQSGINWGRFLKFHAEKQIAVSFLYMLKYSHVCIYTYICICFSD